MTLSLFKVDKSGDVKIAFDDVTGVMSAVREERGGLTPIVNLVLGSSTTSTLDLLAGPDEVAVTNVSQTLAQLLGVALDTDIKSISLVIQTAGVSWADGVAVAGVNNLPAGILSIEGTKAQLDTRQFISTGSVNVSVIQEG